MITASDLLENIATIQNPLHERVYWDDAGKHKISVTDDFIDGHCHDFAIALHRMLGYKLAMIKGLSYYNDTTDKNLNRAMERYNVKPGEEVKHLFHAFGIDRFKQAFDVNGKYNIKQAMNGFKNSFNPDKISFNVYQTEKDFRKKLWTIKVDEGWIKRAYKRISKETHLYFDDRRMKKFQPVKFPKNLVIGKDWNPYESKFEDKFEKRVEKILQNAMRVRYRGWHFGEPRVDFRMEYNKDGMMDVSKSGKSGKINVEVLFNGGYFDTGGDIVKFDVKFKDGISDKESMKSIIKFFNDLGKFIDKITPSLVTKFIGFIK